MGRFYTFQYVLLCSRHKTFVINYDTIISQNNVSGVSDMAAKTFDFYGVHLELDEATDHYIAVYKEYQDIANEAWTQAHDIFESKFPSYESFCLSAKSTYDELFNSYLQKTVRKLVTFKIYDIDEDVLLTEVQKDRSLGYVSAVNEITGSIRTIDAIREQKREENKQLTRSVSGMFFGAAADSADTAITADTYGDVYTSVNANSAAVGEATLGIAAFAAGSAISAISNHVGKKQDEKEKTRIFESEYNRRNIYDQFKNDVFWLNVTFSRLVNERAGIGQYFYFTTDDIVAKDNTICRNIIHGNFMHDSAQPNLENEMISKMLADNPYENRIYSYLLVKNGGLSDDMKQVCEYMGLDKGTLADIYLEELKGPISLYSYEEACSFVDEVAEELTKFGISSCQYYDKAVAKKEELYIIRRTFNSFVYDTIEQRDDAEKQFKEFFGEYDNLSEMELNELVAKYYETYNEDIYPQNRIDLQQIIIPYASEKLKMIKTIEEITPYVDDATEKSKEYNDENMSLLRTFESSLKKLKLKTGIFNAAGAAKDKGKELLAKVPFGKKDKSVANVQESENAPSGANPAQITASDAEAQDNTTESAAKAVGGGAKGLFGKVGGAFSKGKNTKDAPIATTPVAEPVQSAVAEFATETIQSAVTAPVVEQVQEAAAATSIAQPVQQEAPTTKTCPDCGNIVGIEKKFCGKCGYKF